MKLILLNFCLLLSIISLGQDLTGTWEGAFNTNTLIPGRRSSFMHLELKQSGRTIEGIFYYALSSKKDMDIMYQVSGDLGKKKSFPFRLVRGRILYNPGFFLADRFQQLENIQPAKTDTALILYGKWTSDIIRGYDGTAGGFAVKKIDTTHLLLDKELYSNQKKQK